MPGTPPGAEGLKQPAYLQLRRGLRILEDHGALGRGANSRGPRGSGRDLSRRHKEAGGWEGVLEAEDQIAESSFRPVLCQPDH